MSYLALAEDRIAAIEAERAACEAIARAIAEEHRPASESPVDPVRNIGSAQVAVARRIADEISARRTA